MYKTLPAGLKRRLVYSEELSRRRRQRISTPNNNINNPSTGIYIYSSVITFDFTPINRFENINNYETLSSLQDVKIGLISKKILENSTVSLYNKNSDLCVVCQEDISENEIIRTIKCKHYFHINCIDKWLTENKNCPICKYKI